MEYRVRVHRVNSHGSMAIAKGAEVILDTDVKGREDAFNPAELLLAAVAGCMIKSIERAAPALKFGLRGVDISLKAVREDSPPNISSIEYEIEVDTDESDHRLDLLHTNVRKFGTIFNTVAKATHLDGKLVRMSEASAEDLAEEQDHAEREAKAHREQLDSVPPPGTDPLHEGP